MASAELKALLRPEWSTMPPAQRASIARCYALLDPATTELLAFTMPRLLRHLRHRVRRHREESRGGLRGPVHWPGTVRARATRGAGVFIVTTAKTDYDLPENQCLRWLVHALDRALRELPEVLSAGRCAGRSPEPVERRARAIGQALSRLGREPRLAAVALPEALDEAHLTAALETGIPEYQALARHLERFLALSADHSLPALVEVSSRLVLLPGRASAEALPWGRVAALLTARSP